MRKALLAGLLVLFAQFLPVPNQVNRLLFGRPGRPVVFIGNSMTSFHDVPGMVAYLSNQSDCLAGPIEEFAHTPGGVWLDKHWQHGAALKLIADKQPAAVVLQEQSEVTQKHFELRREATSRWIAEIKSIGATPILYHIDIGWWSEEERKRINHESEALSAQFGVPTVNAISLFAALRREDPALKIFGGDNHHLAIAGASAVAHALAEILCESKLLPRSNIPQKARFVWQLWLPAQR